MTSRYDERWMTADGTWWVNAAKHDALAARLAEAERLLRLHFDYGSPEPRETVP